MSESSTQDHDECSETASLYVVDALTDVERDEFEHHLASCPACQQTVADLREVTVRMSSAIPAEPPASLRSSVLAAIAAEPRSQVTVAPSNVVSLQERRRLVRVPSMIAAAAVALALACGGWALQSHHDAQQSQTAERQLTSLLAAPDVHTVSGSIAGGSATLVVSRSQDQTLFVTGPLPALPSGKVYELWTINTTPVPAGTFSPSGAPSVVDLPTASLSSAVVAVTIEPSGGSAQPTTKPVLALDVPHTA